MSEQTPRKGDKVRWTSVIEGVVEDFFPGEIHVNDGGDDPDGNVRVLPMGEASVEILERADDPSKDRTGTVRLEEYDAGFSTWQCVEHTDNPGETQWFCTYTTDPGNVGRYIDHSDMIGLPIIGAGPGTPAAEAEKPAGHCASCECLHDQCGYVIGSPACLESHDGLPDWEREILEQEAARKAAVEEYPEVSGAGVPYPPVDPLTMEQRQRVASLLVDGRRSDAVALVAAIGMPHDKALAYVKSMSEYQTGRNHHQATEDVPLPTPDEARLLLVHPSVWKSLESWLNGVRVKLVRMPEAVDEPVSTFSTELMDGEWPDA